MKRAITPVLALPVLQQAVITLGQGNFKTFPLLTSHSNIFRKRFWVSLYFNSFDSGNSNRRFPELKLCSTPGQNLCLVFMAANHNRSPIDLKRNSPEDYFELHVLVLMLLFANPGSHPKLQLQLEAAAFQERRAQGVAFIQGRNVRRLGRLDLE